MGGGSAAGAEAPSSAPADAEAPVAASREASGSRLELLATLAHVFPGVIVVLREEVLRARRDGLELGRARRPILLLPRARALLLLLALLAALLLLALLLRLLGRRRVPPTAAAAPRALRRSGSHRRRRRCRCRCHRAELQRGDLRVQIIQTARGRHPSRRPARRALLVARRPSADAPHEGRVSREARSERRSTEMNIIARNIARCAEKSCAQKSAVDATPPRGLPRASHPRSSLIPDEPRERGVPRRQRDALDDVSLLGEVSYRARAVVRQRVVDVSIRHSQEIRVSSSRAKPPPVPFRWRR